MKNETNQTTNAILTNAQRELIDNFCKIGKRAKPFGNLYAKKYVGNNNVALEFLNLLKDETQGKYIGKVQAISENGKCFWYLWAIDGETYRILEPSNGIDDILELDFKRNDV